MTRKEVLEVESYLKHNLNFKKKFLDDKSAYWYEKTYKCRFFSVTMTVYDGKDMLVTLRNGQKDFGYDETLDVYKNACISLVKIKEINSYFKKQSSERVSEIKKNNGLKKKI